jgi:hypothetical protein
MTILVTARAGLIGCNLILDWLAWHDESAPHIVVDRSWYGICRA